MRSLIRFLIFVGVVALIVVAIYFARQSGLRAGEAGVEGDSLTALDGAVSGLVDQVLPSVVSITAYQEASPSVATVDQIRSLLGLSDDEAEKPKLGSGMLVSPEGHIVTNLHVIVASKKIEVHLSDGQSFEAKFLGADPLADIAVLKIDALGLPTLKFADSDAVRVGQIVFAIGNPLGLQETVTQGIISGRGRRAFTELTTEFFQTDAAINPGNSGGPLINVRGEIVGVNNAVVLLNSQGISFAIPSNLARRVYEDVVQRGQISRPWFGAIAYPLTPSIARELNVPGTRGNLVVSVLDGSPAQRAGIQAGDVLQEFNGKPLRDAVDIRNRLAEVKVGDLINTRILRAGKSLEIPVEVEQQPW